MSLMMVEYEYEKPITDAELDEASGKLSDCLKAREIKWVKTYVAEDRKHQVCIFEATSPELVQSAYRQANVRFKRVWPAFAPW